MRLTEINLKNFRNYHQVSAQTDADLVLILGDNAAGKTNLLESIYFLSRLKSFRAPDEMLVNHTEDFFSLKGKFHEDELETVVQKTPAVKRGLWRTFNVVLFVPNDLNLFTQGPSARRKFLDEILSQKSQEYALAQVSMDHVLKQKSALLEQLNQGLGNVGELEFWNEQLADAAAVIEAHRLDFLNFINQKINRMNAGLTGFDSKLEIKFRNQAATKAEFLASLMHHQTAEIRSCQNLIGPHRDDFIIEKDGIENIYNSSRGELRAQILSLKLLQAEYLIEGDKKPIILLDDVFSELDETRRTKLIETLQGHQIFITSTEEHHLPEVGKQTLVIKVENNELK
jgi:DNA replication and repair protein RecF